MQIINPATEEIIREVDVDTKETLAGKYELLYTGQPAWQNILLSERIEVIKKFSGLLEKNIESLALILTSEVGKPLQQSRNEINGARVRIKWLTENAGEYLSDEWMTKQEGLEASLGRERDFLLLLQTSNSNKSSNKKNTHKSIFSQVLISKMVCLHMELVL